MDNGRMDGTNCLVKYSDGTPCGRRVAYSVGWCRTCYNYSRTNGGAEPNGREPIRRRGVLREELDSAARSTESRCIYFEGRTGRPKVRYQGSRVNASKAVWMIVNGDPGDRSVLHTCSQVEEGCINIQHLYLGSQYQNCQDTADADRTTRGIRNHSTVLDVTRVQAIRSQLRNGRSQVELAFLYGVSTKTISSIKTGQNWAWLPWP